METDMYDTEFAKVFKEELENIYDTEFVEEFKEEIEIPAGQEEFELTIQVKPDARPQRYQIRWQSQGLVGKYEEEINGPIVTINVKLPPAPKK